MNCRNFERMLLLGQSGELPPRGRNALAAHLAACPACRARRDDVNAITGFMDAMTPSRGPSAAVLERIMTAALIERPVRRTGVLHPAWGRALAAAAALALLFGFAGLTLWRPATARSPVTSATRVAEVSSLLALLMEHDAAAAEAHAAAAEGDLQGFARQLLILEGLSEEVFDEPVDDATRLEERQPTTLQWHSNPEVPAERCA